MLQQMSNRCRQPDPGGVGILQYNWNIQSHANTKNLCREPHESISQLHFVLIFVTQIGQSHETLMIIAQWPWPPTIPFPCSAPTIAWSSHPNKFHLM